MFIIDTEDSARCRGSYGVDVSIRERIANILRAPSRWGGLRAKIVIWFLIPTAIILSAVAVLTFYAYQQVTEDLVFERNQSHTQLLANQLGAEIPDYARSLNALANTPEIYEFDPLLQQATLVTQWPGGDLQAFDGGVLILDDSGIVVATVIHLDHMLGQDLSPLACVGEESGAPQNCLSNFVSGVFPDIDVIALSRPIFNQRGELKGTIVGLFRAERGATRTSQFYRNIWNLYIGRQDTAYLVDGEGTVVFHTDTFLIGDSFSEHEVVQRVLDGESGAVRTRDLDGREVVAGFAPVPDTQWGLVTEEPWSELVRASRPYIRFMLMLLALGVVVPVIVVAVGVRRITDPIGGLIDAAREIAGGKFGRTIEVQTGDELETLAEQFNSMSAQLEASYAQLEQQVEDRTRELATLNAISAVVSRSTELEEILDAALGETLETMGIEAGAAFRLEGEELVLMAHRGLSEGFVAQVERLPLAVSIAAQAVGQAAAVVRRIDQYPESALKDLLQEEGVRVVVGVPLVAKGQILGTLNMVMRSPRDIAPEERTLLEAVGQQAGIAVENARLYEQAEAAAAVAERNRLARELHDAVSQTLFSASIIADVLPRLWERDPEEGMRRLEALRRLTRGAMAEMRTLLVELRPKALVKAELHELLRQLGEAMMGRAEFEIALDLTPVPDLPGEVKVALYRIAQEALNNVVKHAAAGHATVALRYDLTGDGSQAEGGVVELVVEDDGKGFDPGDVPADHFGLENIRERAEGVGAELRIDSRVGRGTRIEVRCRREIDG